MSYVFLNLQKGSRKWDVTEDEGGGGGGVGMHLSIEIRFSRCSWTPWSIEATGIKLNTNVLTAPASKCTSKRSL